MKKSIWYQDGFVEGSQAAFDTDWTEGEMREKNDKDELGEVVQSILENWQQMAGTIYYEDSVTSNKLDKWEEGFFDGFKKQVKILLSEGEKI